MPGTRFNADLKTLFRSKVQSDQYTVPITYGFIDYESEGGTDYYDLFNIDRSMMLCCQDDECIVEEWQGNEVFILNIDDDEEETRFVLTADEFDLVCSND